MICPQDHLARLGIEPRLQVVPGEATAVRMVITEGSARDATLVLDGATARLDGRAALAAAGASDVALVQLDVPAHQVTRDGVPIALTPLEFDLLVALARKPRQVFTRELLLEQVWGYRHAADTRLVNVHVQRLRAKIERDPEKPEVVLTVRGVGYALEVAR